MESIPIRELKNTVELSQRCYRANAPIFITGESGDDMVIMSAEVYRRMRFDDVYVKLMEADYYQKEALYFGLYEDSWEYEKPGYTTVLYNGKRTYAGTF